MPTQIIKVTQSVPVPASIAPIADTTQPGLLRTVSGLATDFIDGTNNSHAISSLLITPNTRTVTAGDGLAGGGDLSANRTLAVDATVGRTGGTSHYYDYDDFVGPAKFMSVGNGAGAGAVSAASVSAFGSGHVGVYQLAPGTAAGLGSWMYMGPFTVPALNSITWRALVLPANAIASASNYHFVGFCGSASNIITPGSYGYAGFYLVPSSNLNWVAYTSGGTGTATAQSSSVLGVAGGWIDLKVVLTATAASYYVNGNLTNTLTTTLPAGTTQLYAACWINSNNNAANYTLYVDAVEIDIDTGVAGRFSRSVI